MISEEEFYRKWRKYFKRNHKYGPSYPDDYEGDVMMLFVTDDVPAEVCICYPHYLAYKDVDRIADS